MIVRLKAIKHKNRFEIKQHFNSMIVRLKVDYSAIIGSVRITFQFYDSPIKRNFPDEQVDKVYNISIL